MLFDWKSFFQSKRKKSYTTPQTSISTTQPDTTTLNIQDESPKKRALLMGISHYPNISLERQNVPGSANDVDLLRDLLSKRFGFSPRNIRCLRNEQATRDGILKAFQDLTEATETDDIVVVQFSGHGSYIRDETKGSGWTETIVPYDSGRKPSGRPNTDIKDVEISERLLVPLVSKTPFVTLLFDSCHSGSIIRHEFGMAIRGIEPDGEIRRYRSGSTVTSEWFNQTPAFHTQDRYTLLASCRADESAAETSIQGLSYGAFTYQLCKQIEEHRHQDLRAIFQLVSANVSSQFRTQHPILEGTQNAQIFGTTRLDTPRYLPINKVYEVGGIKMVDIRGGLANGVTCGSVWAVRPVDAPSGESDALIEVEETRAVESRAKVTRPGHIGAEFVCFEISHDYGDAVLNIQIDKQLDGHPQFRDLRSQISDRNVSGTLNEVQEASNVNAMLVLVKKRSTVAEGDSFEQLGPLNDDSCVTISPDGRLLLPPIRKCSDLCKNLRMLARHQFGLALHNLDEHDKLRGKLNLELKLRRKDSARYDPVPLGEDHFSCFQVGDRIGCVITNNSDITVWPYILEFAEDGSVSQHYPRHGGHEALAAGKFTTEVARMTLIVEMKDFFQLAERPIAGGKRQKGRVTETLKLFASTDRLDLSLLLQTRFVKTRHDILGLSDLLRKGMPDEEDVVHAWETVAVPFVIEVDV